MSRTNGMVDVHHADPLELLRAPERGHEPSTAWRDRIQLRRLVGAVGVVVGVGLAAWWLLHDPAPPIEDHLPVAGPAPVVPTAPAVASSSAVLVHVAGAVQVADVYELAEGDRVRDAVAAAGGAMADADLARVNLAAPVRDGEHIYVPRVGEVPPPVVAAGAAEGAAPVDLNRAGLAELETLPGVGEVTAAAIVAYREERGPFTDVDDLLAVSGIGDAKLETLRPHVTL